MKRRTRGNARAIAEQRSTRRRPAPITLAARPLAQPDRIMRCSAPRTPAPDDAAAAAAIKGSQPGGTFSYSRSTDCGDRGAVDEEATIDLDQCHGDVRVKEEEREDAQAADAALAMHQLLGIRREDLAGVGVRDPSGSSDDHGAIASLRVAVERISAQLAEQTGLMRELIAATHAGTAVKAPAAKKKRGPGRPKGSKNEKKVKRKDNVAEGKHPADQHDVDAFFTRKPVPGTSEWPVVVRD